MSNLSALLAHAPVSSVDDRFAETVRAAVRSVVDLAIDATDDEGGPVSSGLCHSIELRGPDAADVQSLWRELLAPYSGADVDLLRAARPGVTVRDALPGTRIGGGSLFECEPDCGEWHVECRWGDNAYPQLGHASQPDLVIEVLDSHRSSVRWSQAAECHLMVSFGLACFCIRNDVEPSAAEL